LSPFDDEDVIEGQASVAVEIEQQLGRTPDRIILPVGGGGLSAGTRSIEEGAPVDVSPINTFVDGAAVAKIGARTFARLQGVARSDVLDLPEDRICGTIIEMCIASGGNFDFERLPEVKERAQRFAGLKKYFILRLPQRPGALRDFLDTLGPQDNITRFEI